ncbi:MAG: hypothetical protein CVT80_00615 [Alphaproteobacteria bacterium HGW-Alphaproteobacteria-2]|nr:MAG: hypothetical protein CVT80_00615 [Alphaproteobacteria bacterium HGW-Alphaproteobacteria-2]
MRLDHILWAGPDLDALAELFHRLTGVEPAPGGAHPGFGTRNRLVGLGERLYLELIAPDPAQELSGTMGGALAELDTPRLLTVSLSADDLGTAAEAARGAGGAPGTPLAMSRTRPDGVRLDWSILRFEDAARGYAMPFLIDWQGAPHPAGSLAGDCTLDSLTMTDPDPEGFARLFGAMGADLEVAGGARCGGVARLSTPKGPVVLA